MSEAGTYDAIVLAGGRGSRLGGVDKPLLVRNGRTLLDGVLDAVTDASHIVVVGPPTLAAHTRGHPLVHEDPPLGGPVPAIAAGLGALPPGDAPVVVLAADLVDPAEAVAALLAEHRTARTARAAPAPEPPAAPMTPPSRPPTTSTRADGVIAVDPDGRRQPLLAIYNAPALRRAVADLAAHGRLDGLPLRRLVDALALAELPLPADQVRDLDTATDAAELGVSLPPGHPSP